MTQNKKLSYKISDWMGNIIKNGDTVISVKIKTFFGINSFGYLTPNGYDNVWNNKEGQKDCWIILGELHAWEDEGKLFFTTKINGSNYHFESSIFQHELKEDTILCIKGVSDNEELFKLKTLKNKNNMKKNFRISLKENNVNLNSIVVLAAISNANQDNRLTIQEIASKVKMERLSYPASTEDWIVTVDKNFISIDKKEEGENVNLLFIEEVEVFELVEDQP